MSYATIRLLLSSSQYSVQSSALSLTVSLLVVLIPAIMQ